MRSLVNGQSLSVNESITQNWEIIGSAFKLVKELEANSGEKCIKITSNGKPFIQLENGNRIYFSPRKSWKQYAEDLDKTQVWRTKGEITTDEGNILPAGLELVVLPGSGETTDADYDISDYE